MSNRYDPSTAPMEKMHRDEYACDDDWIRDFLKQAHIGHVATRWEAQPFITTVNFWYDQGCHEIYFHTNITGRLRANSERHDRVCFETSNTGKLLPSNIAMEFSVQYESVVVFGYIRMLNDPDEKERALYGLISNSFPGMTAGKHYRPINPQELKHTAVFAIAIDRWSGKRNWSERAEQSEEWPALGPEWFE